MGDVETNLKDETFLKYKTIAKINKKNWNLRCREWRDLASLISNSSNSSSSSKRSILTSSVAAFGSVAMDKPQSPASLNQVALNGKASERNPRENRTKFDLKK